MNIEKLKEINKKISHCELDSSGPSCGCQSTGTPVVAEIHATQRILLVTITPAYGRNSYQELLSREHVYFSKFILTTFFKKYDRQKAFSDVEYYDYYMRRFNRLVYWTHVFKCRPDADTLPESPCSEFYLKKELESLAPGDNIVIIGKEPMKRVMEYYPVSPIDDNQLVVTINQVDFRIYHLPYLMRKRRDDKESTRRHKDTTKLIQELACACLDTLVKKD